MRVNTSAVCYLLNLFKRVDHPNKRKPAKALGWRLVLVTKKLDLEINKGDKKHANKQTDDRSECAMYNTWRVGERNGAMLSGLERVDENIGSPR